MMRLPLLVLLADVAAAVPTQHHNSTTVNSTAHRNPKMTREFIVDECKSSRAQLLSPVAARAARRSPSPMQHGLLHRLLSRTHTRRPPCVSRLR